MSETKIDKKLKELLRKIEDDNSFISFILNYCESQADRKRLLLFIEGGHNDRIEVLLMASQIGIESGTVEGELIDE